jgi:hypothetical protein
MVYLGHVRIGFRKWIQPAGVLGESEEECLHRLRRWVAERQYKRDMDFEGDGELVALLGGTPPWLPCPKKGTP